MAKRTAPSRATAAPAADFPIVGIGCSAGGLEALGEFLGGVPAGCGMAFVIVQHLDPDHASTLAELLQRLTPMQVVEAGDRMALAPDCVYVIPPNHDLSLLHGKLHLLDPTERRGLRLPVDFFLRTVAEDRQDKAVAVILSGMGSDGVLGLRAIKERSGLTLAQEPASAKAASMPQSAIDAGLVDIVAPAAQLPARILAFLHHVPRGESAVVDKSAATSNTLEKVVILLRDHCGADFSLYKTSTLYRRIERRTALHQLAGIAAYVRYLRENPQELDLLFKELLIGVTNFFRDPGVWDTLRDTTLPVLLAQHRAGATLRAWVPACSSGEEAYSLAMVFREALDKVKSRGRVTLQIYATDLDPDAIDKARRGCYPKNIAADVSPERLARFFVAADDGYVVAKDIRDTVIFAPQNIISDPPFTKLDILSCRNLLIYFRPELQMKLLPLFHYALNREGILLLGSAESVGSFDQLFAPADSKARIFRRLDRAMPLAELAFPTRTAAVAATEVAVPDNLHNLGQLTDQLIQQNFAPAAVLVNAAGDILYISGRTGKYLEPAAGKVNINIHAMARDGLREALTGVIYKVLQRRQPVHLNGLQVGTNGGTQIVNVTVQAIEQPEALRGRVLVVFTDVAAATAGKPRKSTTAATHEALQQELQQTREALRVTHEEMQTSVEELKSSNEELQSTNEELQSTNEELTTSKEEMQSMNEELQTVNAELQSKVEDLTWERNDMTNLLNSTEVATVFLDNALKLRRFTAHATRIFKLIPGDVGRLLSDVVCDLDYPQLLADAQDVLRTLMSCEKQVSTGDGRWYRVRIMPYRTQDNMIDGVVSTFIDITAIKQLEAELRHQAG
ncbi:MAG: PAS domain-containing protein [Gammaproteobacteria bacterium]|nr:PAS domain-containing protein [Gammaproteobacteria bacterium]MBU1647473.1 PAS domain-containing protein [Gammaproteobacteria bacterium]MBU1972922.1 PAS domain-containing protein [Gammaproteobacteria bacterium]